MRCAILLSLCGLGLSPALGQSFSLTSGSITSAGGRSSGGDFVIEGSAVPVPSGTSASPRFTLAGGLLNQFFALQGIGSPTLEVVVSPGKLRVTWPVSASGWVLQINELDLDPDEWGDVTLDVVTEDEEQGVEFELSNLPDRAFFRLRRL